jgi:hypothetical protein
MRMRGLAFVTGVASLTAAAVFPALADGPSLPLPTEPLARGAHRFVFADGTDSATAYEGPADARNSLRAAMEQSPGLSPQEAYAEAARASLRALGGDERQFSVDRLAAGADWSGDGIRDVLTVSQSETGTLVTARAGGDGAPLWSWSTRSQDAFGVPAMVGNGEDGVVVLAYSGLGLFVGQVPTLQIVALGRDGGFRWQRTFSGAWTSSGSATVGVGLPLAGGIGRLTPSAATDVVVGRETFVESTESGRVRTAVDVIDGVRGTTATAYRTGFEADELSPVVAPDLTGDGLDDVYLLGAKTVALVSGGTLMWRNDDVGAGRAAPVALGDVTGDGIGDAASSTPPASSRADLWTTVLDGASGRATGFMRGGFAVPAGDVDRDGLMDVGTIGIERRGISTSVVYRAYAARGFGWAPLFRLVYSVHDGRGPSYADVWDAGDVQADGTPDRAHAIRSYGRDGGVLAADEGVVSGRTGLRLWSGRAGTRAPGGIRAGSAGDDLLAALPRSLQAQDGATGLTLWTSDMSRTRLSWAEVLADVDGDGHREVAAYVAQGKPSLRVDAVVLSGLDGRTMWGTNLVVPAD